MVAIFYMVFRLHATRAKEMDSKTRMTNKTQPTTLHFGKWWTTVLESGIDHACLNETYSAVEKYFVFMCVCVCDCVQ